VGAVQVAVMTGETDERGIEGIDELDFWREVCLSDAPGFPQALVHGVCSLQLLILFPPGFTGSG
jgi:hypothetical protein